MDSQSMDQWVAEARERLESTRGAVARAREELSTTSTTARSKDRSVEVTIGPQGELQRVKFLADKYRTMEAAELAASVVDAVAKGRAAMARRVMATFSEITPSNSHVPEMEGYRPDWEQIFGSTLAAGRRGGAKSRGGKSSAKLHDEIVEDDENV